MAQLTAVILTKNNEKTIADCVNSVEFADQILIIDDHSTDRTVEIVKHIQNPKVHVRVHTLERNFADQRNFALQESTGEWVLYVDSDEVVTHELQDEIRIAIQDEGANGYLIPRMDEMWGRQLQYGETGSIALLRLARKNAGKWTGAVHEEWKVGGTVKKLNHHLLHYPHQSIAEFIAEINTYSTMRAEELYAQKVRSNFFWIIAYPKLKFIKNYFVLQGYKDGVAGFVHACMMSFHSFLVRGKLYLLWKGIHNT